jgi:hypothetical protein
MARTFIAWVKRRDTADPPPPSLLADLAKKTTLFMVLRRILQQSLPDRKMIMIGVRHVTGNDQDYLRKIPRAVVQISALL